MKCEHAVTGTRIMKTHRLREVDVYAMIVNQNSLHLEIRLLTVLLMFKLDKGVLKTVFGSLVSNDFAGYNLAKPAEY